MPDDTPTKPNAPAKPDSAANNTPSSTTNNTATNTTTNTTANTAASATANTAASTPTSTATNTTAITTDSTADKVIAIVDDEPHMVEMLSTFLKIKGYQTRGVNSGQEGLVLVQTEKPDAVLLDLMLPDIEGFEVCQKLRAMPDYAKLPILIVSARTDAASQARAEQAGASAYLTKPVNFPLLMTELDRLIKAPSTP